MKYAIIVYAAATFYMWVIISGFVFAYFQKSWPSLAEKNRKPDFFFSILWSALMALIWPLGVIIALEVTERAKRGWERPTRRQI